MAGIQDERPANGSLEERQPGEGSGRAAEGRDGIPPGNPCQAPLLNVE